MTKTEIEEIIKKQEVREYKGYDIKYSKEKYETIGCLGGKFFTIQKAENSSELVVITLWESKEREVNLWVSKKK